MSTKYIFCECFLRVCSCVFKYCQQCLPITMSLHFLTFNFFSFFIFYTKTWCWSSAGFQEKPCTCQLVDPLLKLHQLVILNENSQIKIRVVYQSPKIRICKWNPVAGLVVDTRKRWGQTQWDPLNPMSHKQDESTHSTLEYFLCPHVSPPDIMQYGSSEAQHRWSGWHVSVSLIVRGAVRLSVYLKSHLVSATEQGHAQIDSRRRWSTCPFSSGQNSALLYFFFLTIYWVLPKTIHGYWFEIDMPRWCTSCA